VARDYQSPIVPLIRQKWFPDPQEVLPILLVKRLLRVYPSMNEKSLAVVATKRE
jgi:hypothetical protein